METKITRTIKSRIDNIEFGFWEGDTETFHPLVSLSAAAASQLGITPELLQTLLMFQADLKDNLAADLADIWQRLDKAGL